MSKKPKDPIAQIEREINRCECDIAHLQEKRKNLLRERARLQIEKRQIEARANL